MGPNGAWSQERLRWKGQQQFTGLDWQFSSAQELTAEGSTSWSQQSEVGVKWLQACEVVSSEAEEPLPLEAVTKQCDWEC
jgi:hypothetical protein